MDNFEDFDTHIVYENLCKKVEDPESLNFVLDFNGDQARCAFDLRDEVFKSLILGHKDPTDLTSKQSTRWINLWMPERQSKKIDVIARHYGFSPRLKSSMTCSHITRVLAPHPLPQQHRTVQEVLQGVPKRDRDAGANAFAIVDDDVESTQMEDLETYKRSTLDINHYTIVDEVWHFASIDWGLKFTCIGFNSLYAPRSRLSEDSLEGDKPAGKRVWTWLVLCNDRTVISIHENPYPHAQQPSVYELQVIRRNLRNTFAQLSKVAKSSQNPIMTVNIRPKIHEEEGDEAQLSEDAVPSLLLYYLFDDWYNSYALVARKEHEYSRHLEDIRLHMFESPDIDHARRLHRFGRQLAVLKRVYQSYTMLIDKLLKGPQAGKSSAFLSTVRSEQPKEVISQSSERRYNYGVPMSTAAALRFERLRDRIDLYAISEIQSCLEEKEDLVLLNFNLVALKESSYIEKLTRVTILLAKVTILFLPVTLMSAYFAIPIVGYGDSYTLTDYWVAFAVILGISIIGLIIFGQLSGTQEGAPMYRSLTQVGYDFGMRLFGREHRPKRKRR